MACYECGSELGDNYRLCPNCVKRKNLALATLREDIKRVPDTDAITHRLAQEPRFKVILFLLVWAACAVGITLGWNKIYVGIPISGAAVAVMSLIAVLLLVHSLTGLYFWVKMATLDLWWFVICLFAPFAAYYYVFRYWDETKINFAIHLISLALALLLIFVALPLVVPVVG